MRKILLILFLLPILAFSQVSVQLNTGAEREDNGNILGLTLPKIVDLETYEGSGEVVHPSVIYIRDGFGYEKWQYWMANTPYSNSDGTKENPSIWASHDGMTWVVPSGLTNPIVAYPGSGHNADTELIYDGDTLWCFYIQITSSVAGIRSINSADGITWINDRAVKTGTFATERLLSPAIVDSSGTYYMYYVLNNPSTQVRSLKRVTSSDLRTWASEATITIGVTPSGKDIWHIGVRQDTNYVPSYEMILTVCDTLTSGTSGINYFAYGTSEVFTITNRIIQMAMSQNSSEDYRGCMVKVYTGQNEKGKIRDMWFGASGDPNGWSTIHMKVKRDINYLFPYLTEETYVPRVVTDHLLFTAEDTTVTAEVGKIVFKVSDSTFYGCTSTSAAKKWYPLN